MAELGNFEFTKDWTNPTDFPTYEPSEAQVRADMQCLYNEIKDYLNGTLHDCLDGKQDAIPAANGTGTGSLVVSDTEGNDARGMYAVAAGYHTSAEYFAQHVFGAYNAADPIPPLVPPNPARKGEYIEMVGNGTDASHRSNARALDWQGNEVLKGDLYVRSTDTSDFFSKVATTGELQMGLAAKQNTLTFDNAPTADSNNPVKSGGIKTALDGKQDKLTTTQRAAVNSGANSTNIAQIGTNATAISGIKDGTNIDSFGDVEAALAGKQDAIHAANGTGTNSLVLGDVQHNSAEGEGSIAAGVGCSTGDHAHGSLALGHGTVAGSLDQLVFGRYNKPDTENKYTEIVGNGAGLGRTSNARTLDRQGNETLAGKLTLGALPTGEMDAVPRCLVTNPNLLDNAYFVGGGSGFGIFPINQRYPQTQYSAAGNIFDRWKLVSGTATLTAAGLVLNGTITQAISPAPDGDLTCSALTTEGLVIPTYSNGVFTLVGTGQTFLAAKLERGSISTLAHQESGAWVPNEIPRYNDELLRCQARLLRLNGTATQGAVLGYGFVQNSTEARFFIPTPVSFAGTPNISVSGSVWALINGSFISLSDFSVLNVTKSGVWCSATAASALGTNFSQLLFGIDRNASITISAESN